MNRKSRFQTGKPALGLIEFERTNTETGLVTREYNYGYIK